ncbi:hypothetical protein [Halioxenophilus aromaticivorans]|uniref:hypothetical protein n=1 Tax=Halioxenophilus aromaticivorans TaxID=1306992 RepID=UPI0031E65966
MIAVQASPAISAAKRMTTGPCPKQININANASRKKHKAVLNCIGTELGITCTKKWFSRSQPYITRRDSNTIELDKPIANRNLFLLSPKSRPNIAFLFKIVYVVSFYTDTNIKFFPAPQLWYLTRLHLNQIH